MPDDHLRAGKVRRARERAERRASTPTTRVRTPYGEAFIACGQNAPTDADEDRTFAVARRVQRWDLNVRNGWMPLASGRKRVILPAE